MRLQPAGVLLELDDALELEPRLRALARIHRDTAVRRLADLCAELVADSRTADVAGTSTSWLTAGSVVGVSDAAAALDVSPRTVRRRAAARQLPARKVGGRWEIQIGA